METKRNLKYFTAPPFNVGTIIGLVVAVLGLLYWIIFGGRRGGANTLVQVVSWYDNENSYASQMVRTIKYFSELK